MSPGNRAAERPMAPRCSCDAIVEITGYTGSLSNLAVI